jgi:hypothetical protein
MRTTIPLLTISALAVGALLADATSKKSRLSQAQETTRTVRQLAADRIETIARTPLCREDFAQQQIDLERLRLTLQQVRFYSIDGQEGDLKFSDVIGVAASPDQTLRTLAGQVLADAFVLGYQDGRHYVRTRHVVLNRGYFEQRDVQDGAFRPTTVEEKQSLLLHELLHIALNKDDDALNERALCPLRLLAFCRRPSGAECRQ